VVQAFIRIAASLAVGARLAIEMNGSPAMNAEFSLVRKVYRLFTNLAVGIGDLHRGPHVRGCNLGDFMVLVSAPQLITGGGFVFPWCDDLLCLGWPYRLSVAKH
jgi:hypothetical protein